jgi:hypothetical protein
MSAPGKKWETVELFNEISSLRQTEARGYVFVVVWRGATELRMDSDARTMQSRSGGRNHIPTKPSSYANEALENGVNRSRPEQSFTGAIPFSLSPEAIAAR